MRTYLRGNGMLNQLTMESYRRPASRRYAVLAGALFLLAVAGAALAGVIR